MERFMRSFTRQGPHVTFSSPKVRYPFINGILSFSHSLVDASLSVNPQTCDYAPISSLAAETDLVPMRTDSGVSNLYAYAGSIVYASSTSAGVFGVSMALATGQILQQIAIPYGISNRQSNVYFGLDAKSGKAILETQSSYVSVKTPNGEELWALI
jgi:hypothetical protein